MADTAATAPASPGASENNPSAQAAASDGGGFDPRTPAGGGDDSQNRYLVANGNGVMTLNQSDYLCVMQMPLPGIVIFVHGVNSEESGSSRVKRALRRFEQTAWTRG